MAKIITMVKDITYDELKELVKNVVNEFLTNSIEIDNLDIFTDDDFNEVISTTDISNRLSDGDASFDDGVAIGVDIGFRIGMVHLLEQMAVIKSICENNVKTETTDITEISPEDIAYL